MSPGRIALETPDVDGIAEAVDALRSWQTDASAFQLHPGDLGWFQRLGAERTAAALRLWRRDRRIVALGLLDGPEVLRLTTEPAARGDRELAAAIRDDLADPTRGIDPTGEAAVELPSDAVLDEVLAEAGWRADEPWAPLVRDLAEPVTDPSRGRDDASGGDQTLRIETLSAEHAPAELVEAWAHVLRGAFGNPASSAERWHPMAAGPAAGGSRTLVGFDPAGAPVATITVWSAGPGRPGLVEPMGVHPDGRGRGAGRAICLAGAAVLRELGASSAAVATRSANTGGVATYVSAGFVPQTERRDRVRG